MNTNVCEDCNNTTSGRCWKHSIQTVIVGPATYTHSVFVDENANLKTALQKLINKLEAIEKDGYTKNLYNGCFRLWKNELAEAKKALEVSNKPSVVYNTTSRDVDLFDLNQLPLKDENEF